MHLLHGYVQDMHFLIVLGVQMKLIDEQYLQQVTQHHTHRLVVTGDDAVPTQISKGRKIPRLDNATTQEEADLIITQQAIRLAKEDGESRVCVLCDDTDVFALLVYFFSREQLQSSMTMESPIYGRSCIDIKETARQHDAIIPAILPLHTLTGCDSVAATYMYLERQRQSLWHAKDTRWTFLVNRWQTLTRYALLF